MVERDKKTLSSEHAALKASDKYDAREILAAKPIKTPIDQAQLRRELMKQFSKTLAYLAK
jgi:hypothetical protein